MAGPVGRTIRSARPLLRPLACGICFGIAGLIWSVPRLRTRRLRRAATCQTCAAHMRMRNVAVLLVAALLLAGAVARTLEATSPQIVCHSHITPDGQVQPEPYLQISPPIAWSITHQRSRGSGRSGDGHGVLLGAAAAGHVLAASPHKWRWKHLG
jgi:hypothetical protein